MPKDLWEKARRKDLASHALTLIQHEKQWFYRVPGAKCRKSMRLQAIIRDMGYRDPRIWEKAKWDLDKLPPSFLPLIMNYTNHTNPRTRNEVWKAIDRMRREIGSDGLLTAPEPTPRQVQHQPKLQSAEPVSGQDVDDDLPVLTPEILAKMIANLREHGTTLEEFFRRPD